MTDKILSTRAPRCPIRPGGLVDDARRCGREAGHDGLHRLFSGYEWSDVGSYTRTTPDPDDTDGGVTAALIEQEAEKPTAHDFAKAEFARHPGESGVGMRKDAGDPNTWCVAYEDPGWRIGIRSDIEMARDGWSPVRECPDPEQHDAESRDEREHIGPEGETDWHGMYLDENRRAEKAERERGEALRTVQEVLDSHDETLRDIASGKYAAEHPHPLTPDAIPDQFVDYVHEDYFWSTSDRVRLEKPALKHALLDAVKRLAEASARPEGAEEIERLIETSPWHLAGSCSAEADWLAKRGVRVVGEEQS